MMPLKIMKLAVAADPAMDLVPTVSRFFHETTALIAAGTLTIPVDEFWTDTGADAAELPPIALDNGYINVYINGVLQMESLLAYTPGPVGTGQLAITIPARSTILIGTPVVLVITNFTPDSETVITT